MLSHHTQWSIPHTGSYTESVYRGVGVLGTIVQFCLPQMCFNVSQDLSVRIGRHWRIRIQDEAEESFRWKKFWVKGRDSRFRMWSSRIWILRECWWMRFNSFICIGNILFFLSVAYVFQHCRIRAFYLVMYLMRINYKTELKILRETPSSPFCFWYGRHYSLKEKPIWCSSRHFKSSLEPELENQSPWKALLESATASGHESAFLEWGLPWASSVLERKQVFSPFIRCYKGRMEQSGNHLSEGFVFKMRGTHTYLSTERTNSVEVGRRWRQVLRIWNPGCTRPWRTQSLGKANSNHSKVPLCNQ